MKMDKSSWETIAITFIELVYLKVCYFVSRFGNKNEEIKQIIINGGAIRLDEILWMVYCMGGGAIMMNFFGVGV